MRESLSSFFPDFGASATFAGGAVSGVFDNGFGDAQGMAGSQPSFMAAASDLAGVVQGASVTIGGVAYSVAGIEPDGTGMTRLRLLEA